MNKLEEITQLNLRIWSFYAYNILSEEYGIRPKFVIKFERIKNGIPACCTVECDKHIIFYDVDMINENFHDYIKLIAIHEIIHLFVDELIVGLENKNIGGGHNELFLQIMRSFKPVFTEKEWEMHKDRHISQYINDRNVIEKRSDIPRFVEKIS